MAVPPIIPTPASLATEVATAQTVAAEKPTSHNGRTRAQGQALTDWLTNVAYWRLYDECPVKLPAKGEETCRAAWIRLRTAVDLALHQQAPPPPAGSAWTWPLQALPRKWTGGGSFGARRPWKGTQTRYHCGLDIKAPPGQLVLAPEAGVIMSGDHGWESKKVAGGKIVGVRAVVIRADAGRTILLGGIRPGTGLAAGTRVTASQPVGEVGTYPLGDSMLHVQLWDQALTLSQVIARQSWRVGRPRPAGLIDPAPLLRPILKAAPQAMMIEETQADESVEVDEGTPAGRPTAISVAELIAELLGGGAVA